MSKHEIHWQASPPASSATASTASSSGASSTPTKKPSASSSIASTLDERAERYGDYETVALISQGLKVVMHDAPNWHYLPPYQQESLDMIANKIARALNGDPKYVDTWHDLAGYATLVEMILNGLKP